MKREWFYARLRALRDQKEAEAEFEEAKADHTISYQNTHPNNSNKINASGGNSMVFLPTRNFRNGA